MSPCVPGARRSPDRCDPHAPHRGSDQAAEGTDCASPLAVLSSSACFRFSVPGDGITLDRLSLSLSRCDNSACSAASLLARCHWACRHCRETQFTWRGAQRWNNPWHGRAAGATERSTLEDGCLVPPSGVRRAGRSHCRPHRDVVWIHTVGPGCRGDHLARGRCRDVGRGFLVPARASRAATWVLVDAVHAHPRHCPRPVVGPHEITGISYWAAEGNGCIPVAHAGPHQPSRRRSSESPTGDAQS